MTEVSREDSPYEESVDVIYCLSNGKRKMIRLFVTFEGERFPMDIPDGETIAAIKQLVRQRFCIQEHQAQLGDANQEKNTLVLSYGGAELADSWVISDLHIAPGSTLRAHIKEELDPVFYFKVVYNNDTIPIMDRIKIMDFSVADLRSMASRRTGLPVCVFRLVNKSGIELYDCHTMDDYGIKPGDVIFVETWNGWSEFLKLAALGFTSHVMAKLSTTDEVLARFQMKVAMYMAAHFGQVDLAVTLTRHGIRADEAIGEHPFKQWCSVGRHVDLRKAPVHEAVEANQLGVLRTFVHQNVCCITAKNGNGLQPLNLALRLKMKACASFILTKQWSRIPFNSESIPLAIYSRLREWADRSRERVQMIFGADKISVRKRTTRENPLVGQGVYVDGFSPVLMSTHNEPVSLPTRHSKAVEDYYRQLYSDDPEEYFRWLMQHAMRLPKIQSKWSRMAGPKVLGGKEGLSPGDNGGGPTGQDSEAAMSDDTSAFGGGGPTGSPEGGGRRTNLPPIHEIKAQKPSVVTAPNPVNQPDDEPSRRSSLKSSYSVAKKVSKADLSPPKPAANVSLEKKKKKRRRSDIVSATILAKAQATDSSVPLPLISVEDTPRPFFHVRHGQVNEARSTLDVYELHRGMGARDFAIHCLSVANTFKERPWLHQVRLAMDFAQQGVKKSVHRSNGRAVLASPERKSAVN